MSGPNTNLKALAPIANSLTPTATEPLTGRGILNQSDLGTTAVKMLSARTDNNTRIRRCKLVCVTADVKIAWGTTSAIKADGDGSADEGSIIVSGPSGGAVEWFDLDGSLDLYVVASAASTVINLTVEEV